MSSGSQSVKGKEVVEEDRLLTVVEAARLLNLSVGGLYHKVSARQIKVVKLSARCIRFRRQDLLEWIESKTQPADGEEFYGKSR
jgi:excisionase family DNA binding protein